MHRLHIFILKHIPEKNLKLEALSFVGLVAVSEGGAFVTDLVGSVTLFEECFDIGQGGVGDVGEGLLSQEGLVRGNDYIRHGDQSG